MPLLADDARCVVILNRDFAAMNQWHNAACRLITIDMG
jgi:hypothetical protein